MRSAYRSYTDFPWQQVLEASVSESLPIWTITFDFKKAKKTKFATSFYVTPKTTSGNSFEEAELFFSSGTSWPKSQTLAPLLRLCRHFGESATWTIFTTEKFGKNPSHFKVIFSVHANLQLVLVLVNFVLFPTSSHSENTWKYHSLMRNCKRTNFTKSFQSWRLEVKSSWP